MFIPFYSKLDKRCRMTPALTAKSHGFFATFARMCDKECLTQSGKECLAQSGGVASIAAPLVRCSQRPTTKTTKVWKISL